MIDQTTFHGVGTHGPSTHQFDDVLVIGIDRQSIAGGRDGCCGHNAQGELAALRAAHLDHFNVFDLRAAHACSSKVKRGIAHHQSVGADLAVHRGIGCVVNQGVVAAARQDGVNTCTAINPVGIGICDDAAVVDRDAVAIATAQHVFKAVQRIVVAGVSEHR